MTNFDAVNKIYAAFFTYVDDYPARSAIAIKTLPKSAKLKLK